MLDAHQLCEVWGTPGDDSSSSGAALTQAFCAAIDGDWLRILEQNDPLESLPWQYWAVGSEAARVGGCFQPAPQVLWLVRTML